MVFVNVPRTVESVPEPIFATPRDQVKQGFAPVPEARDRQKTWEKTQVLA